MFQPSLSSPSSSVCSSSSSFAALTSCIVTLITGLILCGLIIDLGGGPDHKRLGFTVSKGLEFSYQRPDLDVQYWKHPGALNGPGLVKSKSTDHFLGWVSVLVQAGFSFQGMELVAM